ncbi:hypothetical protein [Galbibacter sp. PAP.153]|uniref:hypothetical protein n=1 Tax=Galbibacter sp. PAP.153 TaxID=3104623 RepID=UPI00300A3A49
MSRSRALDLHGSRSSAANGVHGPLYPDYRINSSIEKYNHPPNDHWVSIYL